MARAKATISQPGIKARRTIFGVGAKFGSITAKARKDVTVGLRAEFGVGFQAFIGILSTGLWNDSGTWSDLLNWNDGA